MGMLSREGKLFDGDKKYDYAIYSKFAVLLFYFVKDYSM